MSVFHKGERITDYYKFEDEIGRYVQQTVLTAVRGSFAIVKSAVNKKTGERVAVKIIER